ncbi:DUF3152 domain-containing protein [Streptomyces sp. NPDC097610]|uniref:DUF3152 domain-containing protein n=1 Tax=Streptomyces sp. NPDC097610 TaxID=3157227 RepID=UPI003321C6A5
MNTTAHRATPPAPRSHRRRGGPAHADGRGRTGKGPLLGGVAALAVLVSVAALAINRTTPTTSGSADRPAAAARPSRSAPDEPSKTPDRSTRPSGPATGAEHSEEPGSRTSGMGAPSAGSSSPSASSGSVPSSGPGTFTTAGGGSGTAGRGSRLLRYEVVVEDGLKQSAADVAKQVEGILADPRGWTADGESAFRRVTGGTPDFVVRLATPGTVDKICGRYGLDTGGEVNCSGGKDVVVNLRRWLLATPVYAHDVAAYRALIINHEVGHFLGHHHVTCPGVGRPAPVMMQQIKGMHGCVPNVWPYDREGRLITGPAVS